MDMCIERRASPSPLPSPPLPSQNDRYEKFQKLFLFLFLLLSVLFCPPTKRSLPAYLHVPKRQKKNQNTKTPKNNFDTPPFLPTNRNFRDAIGKNQALFPAPAAHPHPQLQQAVIMMACSAAPLSSGLCFLFFLSIHILKMLLEYRHSALHERLDLI